MLVRLPVFQFQHLFLQLRLFAIKLFDIVGGASDFIGESRFYVFSLLGMFDEHTFVCSLLFHSEGDDAVGLRLTIILQNVLRPLKKSLIFSRYVIKLRREFRQSGIVSIEFYAQNLFLLVSLQYLLYLLSSIICLTFFQTFEAVVHCALLLVEARLLHIEFLLYFAYQPFQSVLFLHKLVYLLLHQRQTFS